MSQEPSYNIRTLRSRKLSLTSSTQQAVVPKRRKLDHSSQTNNNNVLSTKQRQASRRPSLIAASAIKNSKDIDSIEYVDRIIRYYSQSHNGSILSEDDEQPSINDFGSHFMSDPKYTELGSFELDIGSSVENHKAHNENQEEAQIDNDEEGYGVASPGSASSLDSTYGPKTPSVEPESGNNNIVDCFNHGSASLHNGNLYNDSIPSFENAIDNLDGTASETLEDFISYEDYDDEDADVSDSDSSTSNSDLESLQNGSNGGAKFYNIFGYNKRKLASLDYRCHDKLNLALIDVAPRKLKPVVFPAQNQQQPIANNNKNVSNSNVSNSNEYNKKTNSSAQCKRQYTQQRNSAKQQHCYNSSSITVNNSKNANANTNNTASAATGFGFNFSPAGFPMAQLVGPFQQPIPYQQVPVGFPASPTFHNANEGQQQPMAYPQFPPHLVAQYLPGAQSSSTNSQQREQQYTPPSPPAPIARKDLPGVIVTKSSASAANRDASSSSNGIDYKTKYYQYLQHKYNNGAGFGNSGSRGTGRGSGSSTVSAAAAAAVAASMGAENSELALNKRSVLSGKGNEMVVEKNILLNELF